jgi:hypothetical protein
VEETLADGENGGSGGYLKNTAERLKTLAANRESMNETEGERLFVDGCCNGTALARPRMLSSCLCTTASSYDSWNKSNQIKSVFAIALRNVGVSAKRS